MSLKDKRKEAKLTQDELSELSGIPKRTIQEWEKNPGSARAGSIKVLADLFGCTIEELL